MRYSESARYARWSAGAAILLSVVVAGVYARRTWHGPQVRAAASVPASVQQQTAGFSMSKVDGNHTQFTLRAAKATEYKDGGRSLLEDVWVTSYGDTGERSDNLHTPSCEYTAASGLVTCAGQVQIDLQSSAEASPSAANSNSLASAARVMHISTSRLSFDSKSGVATSDQPVDFHFSQGDGRAVGFQFESHAGMLHLLRDVHLTLRPSAASTTSATTSGSAKTTLVSTVPATGFGATPTPAAVAANPLGSGEVNISSSALTYSRDESVIHFLGPVEANQGVRTLRAPWLNAELDADMNVRRIVAGDHPVVSGVQDGNPASLSADQIDAHISSDGWIEHVTAMGTVRADGKHADAENRLTARQVELEYGDRNNVLRRMTAKDDVIVQSEMAGGTSKRLSTAQLVVDFAAEPVSGEAHPQHATTPAATIDSAGPVQVSGKPSVQHVHMTSNQLEMNFAGQDELRDLRGTGGVEMQRQVGDGIPVASSSRELFAQFIPGGDWSTVELTTNVRVRQGEKIAETPHAHFDHSTETATLAGPLALTDESSRTTAQSGKFVQTSNEFRADGDVVTSQTPADPPADVSAAANTPHGPSRISADHLLMNTMTEDAIYSGHSRLWQGDSVIEADTVELDHGTQTLTAVGSVRAVFPRTQTQTASGATAPPPSNGQRQFMHAEAGRLTYVSAEHRAHLEQSPKARTDQGSIRSSTMDLFFVPEDPPANAASGVKSDAKGTHKTEANGNTNAGSKVSPSSPRSTPAAIGDQSVERAVALGDVVIDGDDRHGKSARADYTPADGKFVLSGEHSTVYDGSGNTANGRQLTFVFGDDRIVVDSEQGTRTLTLHRVEK